MVNSPVIHLEALAREAHRAIAASVGGDEAVDLVGLLIPIQEDPSSVLLYTSSDRYKTSFLPLVTARAPMLARLAEGAGARLAGAEKLADLVVLEDSTGWVRGAQETGPAVFAMARHERQWAAFYIRLTDRARIPDVAILGRLQEVVQEFVERADPLIDNELLRHRYETLCALQSAVMRPLIAPDKAALVAELAQITESFFGFSRVYVSLYQPGSRSYRLEAARGFDAASIPFSITLNRSEDFAESCLVIAVESGKVRFYPRDGENAPEVAAIAGRDSSPDEPNRAALIPLRIGERPLGFIYADRPRTKGVFLCANAVETFAAFASAALENVTLREGAEERAQIDPLTGLYNRRYLDRILEIEGARIRRYKNPISLIMLDVCYFKRVNEALGHALGDQMLRETAVELERSVRAPDIVIRYGGDEFVILLTNTAEEHAHLVARRIEAAFERRNAAIDSDRLKIHVCMGVSSADANTFHDLLAEADRQLYQRKIDLERRLIVEALLGAPAARADAMDNVISSLLTSLSKREPYYQMHSRRVAYLCLVLSKSLGLAPSEIRAVLLAALLHDVGKVSLPGEILRRPGPLDAEESEAVRNHPIVGEEFFKGLAYMEASRPFIRHHHERFDGQTTGDFPGYPAGLRGEEIPLGARVLKLADCVDAMLSDRPYQQARPIEEVMRIVRQEAGASFDPRLVELLASAECLERLDSPEELLKLYDSIPIHEPSPARDAV